MHEQQNSRDKNLSNLMWTQCNLVLRRVAENKFIEGLISESYQSLDSQVDVQTIELEEPFKPQFRMIKPFHYQSQKGVFWNIHYRVPKFIVSIPKKYYEQFLEEEQIAFLECEIVSAYVRPKQNHFYLDEIKLYGNNRKKFNLEGEVEFQQLQFSASSFRKQVAFKQFQMNKFSLVIIISARCIQQQKMILQSYMSSGLLVTPFIRRNRQNKRKIKQNNRQYKLQKVKHKKMPMPMENQEIDNI